MVGLPAPFQYYPFRGLSINRRVAAVRGDWGGVTFVKAAARPQLAPAPSDEQQRDDPFCSDNAHRGRAAEQFTHEADIAQYAKRVVTFRDGVVLKDTPVTSRLFASDILKDWENPAEAMQ